MDVMRRILPLVVVLMLLVAGRDARAWNPAGHIVIASIAYDQLTPPQRARLVGLLKSHPRFEPDFASAMPDGLTSDQQSRWIFMRAATWPDIARSLVGEDQKYNHPTWHYIDWPVYLDDAARGKIHPPMLELDYRAARDDATLNAVQALNKSMAELEDGSTSPAQKAVALCWVLHLCGDIHQPLHGAALYSAARFRKLPLGDRGGNDIPVEQKVGTTDEAYTTNLHAIWDGLLGKDESFQSVVAAAQNLEQRFPPAKFAEAAKNIDAAAWSRESHDLAERVAYAPTVRQSVSTGEAHPLAPLPPVVLSDEYFQQAHAVAAERAALAGYRTANMLQSIK